MHFNTLEVFPKEILYDNMKQVVIKRALKSSDSKWNAKFEDFFKHFGFIPRLCHPRRAQTKGKIENTVGYVKRDFFLGGDFSSLQDMNLQVMPWLNRVNSSVDGTTHEIPFERLKIEGLQPIHEVPSYLLIQEKTRKISRDCFISYLGNKYSVPYQYAGREATLQILDGTFWVIVGGKQICEHQILPGSGRVLRNKEHFKGLLSEILKENKACMKKSHSVLTFSRVDMEKCSLSVYEEYAGGV